MGDSKNDTINTENTDIKKEDQLTFEDINEVDVRALKPIMQRFMTVYRESSFATNNKKWLTAQLAVEMPDKDIREIEAISRDIIEHVKKFDNNMTSINQACDAGQPKEQWFCDKMQDAAIGVSVNSYGNYLANIDRVLHEANTQLMRVVTTQSGEISQCFNLDGFIAEQQHVNSFNANAALENKSYYAKVQSPETGETYGKNSFDVVIEDIKSGKRLHQYQFKFGKNAKSTIKMLHDGTYNNQRFIVPKEQLNEVRRAFPSKNVSDVLGGTSKVPTMSEPMTKVQVKANQQKVQEKYQINSMDWNKYSTRDLAIHLGKNAVIAGIGGAALATGIQLVVKMMKNEKIDTNEAVKIALTTGTDAGVKAAAAGALTVWVEKGFVPIVSKGTPIGVLTNIACLGIENIKIMLKLAKGEINGIKALDCMARTSVVTIYGLSWGASGTIFGSMVGSVVPLIGTVVGGIIGGMVGYAAGVQTGNLIYNGMKTIAGIAKREVESCWNTMKSVSCRVWSGIKVFGSKIYI